MSLVRVSVTPATWSGHGKAWAEWWAWEGDAAVVELPAAILGVTISYLLWLREQGVSAVVAQRRLSGDGLYLNLRGWPDVTKDSLIRQVIKGWSKEQVRRERCVKFPLNTFMQCPAHRFILTL